jgi:hypothetical protein
MILTITRHRLHLAGREIMVERRRRLSYPFAFPSADEDTVEGRGEATIAFVVDHSQYA